MTHQKRSWPERQRLHWGKLIREQRKLVCLTQDALAEAVHVKQSAVSMWEQGYSAPSPLHQRRIADALSITPDALFPHLPLDEEVEAS